MSETEIGGDLSNRKFARIFLVGVAIGTVVRVAAFLFPAGLVRLLEERLLPGSDRS